MQRPCFVCFKQQVVNLGDFKFQLKIRSLNHQTKSRTHHTNGKGWTALLKMMKDPIKLRPSQWFLEPYSDAVGKMMDNLSPLDGGLEV